MQLATCNLLLLSLTACGFQPIYAERAEVASAAHEELTKIEITTMHSPLGAYFRSQLESLFNPAGQRSVSPDYALSAVVTEEKSPVVIRPDGSISRYNLQLYADVTLVCKATGEKLKHSRERRLVAYNVVDSDYASFIAEQDAREHGVKEMAEDIRLMLSGYFSQHKAVCK